jgi:apolipoprotein N-acyltransferase
MVNITNDGWFGKSTAPYQHLNLIRYRAIEHGYPVARVANSGITTFIDQYGHFSERTTLFSDRVLISKIPLRTKDTLYFHIGDFVEKGLLIFLLAYLILMFIQIKFSRINLNKV